jgi:hypothetical protein
MKNDWLRGFNTTSWVWACLTPGEIIPTTSRMRFVHLCNPGISDAILTLREKVNLVAIPTTNVGVANNDMSLFTPGFHSDSLLEQKIFQVN